MKVKFMEWDCLAQPCYYGNKRIAILLVDAEDKAPVAKATINMPEVELKPDQVIVKDYAENAGMTAALIEAGIIKPEEDGIAQAGHCMAGIHTLTEEYMKCVQWHQEKHAEAEAADPIPAPKPCPRC